MQKLTAWKFHNLPLPRKFAVSGADGPQQNRDAAILALFRRPSAPTLPLIGGTTAGPAGSSEVKLHRLPARPEGARGAAAGRLCLKNLDNERCNSRSDAASCIRGSDRPMQLIALKFPSWLSVVRPHCTFNQGARPLPTLRIFAASPVRPPQAPRRKIDQFLPAAPPPCARLCSRSR